MQRMAYIGVFAMLAQCSKPAYRAERTAAENREAFNKRLTDSVFMPALHVQMQEKTREGLFRTMHAFTRKTPLTQRLLALCPAKIRKPERVRPATTDKYLQEAKGRKGYLPALEITNKQSYMQNKFSNFLTLKINLL